MPTLAVHITDGVLAGPWLAAGFLGALLLALPGLHGIREDEIPRLGLMTAAFFVASSIHLPLPPTSVHLLLNGLVGVVLGRRAGLAILVGLLLQYVFISHGGLSTVGVNACVLTLPALLAAGLFRALHWSPFIHNRWGRGALTFASAFLLLGSVAATGQALIERLWGTGGTPADPHLWAAGRIGLIVLMGLSVAAAVGERRLENQPAFPLGCLLGVSTVLLTVALQAAVLLLGVPGLTEEPVLVIVLAHLPVAAVEGIVVGSVVAFLAQVQPTLLGRPPVTQPTGDLPPVQRE
jgi:cobalt/nickel transport system permease protein